MAHPASACKSFKSPARVIRCIKWSWRLQSWRGAGEGFRRFSTFGPACLPPPPYTQAPLPKEAKKDEMRRGKGGAPCRSRSRSLASPSHALLARSRPRSLVLSRPSMLDALVRRRRRSLWKYESDSSPSLLSSFSFLPHSIQSCRGHSPEQTDGRDGGARLGVCARARGERE